MDVENEHKYWNMECEKPILVRSTKTFHNELSQLQSDVVALQETRLESFTQKLDNFTLFNTGSESKKHGYGCRFYVRGEF